MSTRSTIGIEEPDGTIMSIYCHNDGYLSWNGVMLHVHYSEEAKLRELLDLGDISALGKNLAPLKASPTDFSASVTAYVRDKGSPVDVSQPVFTNNRDSARCQEYDYLWVVAEQRWVFNDDLNPGWHSLAEDEVVQKHAADFA